MGFGKRKKGVEKLSVSNAYEGILTYFSVNTCDLFSRKKLLKPKFSKV